MKKITLYHFLILLDLEEFEVSWVMYLEKGWSKVIWLKTLLIKVSINQNVEELEPW